MLELEIFIMLKRIIEAAEPYFGIPLVDGRPGVLVAQSYQPTQQGVARKPTAFIEKIGDIWIGQPLREDYFDDDEDEEVHRETQQMITRFQLSALATQDPASTTQLTASDIVNYIAMILKNSQTIAEIEELGCGITLDKDTRNPKFLDDRGRFEASPSLDFGISHKLIVSREQHVLQSQELQIIVI